MEIDIIEENKNKIIINIKNEDIGFFSVLTDELNNKDDVKFSGYNVDHPLIKNIRLLVELNDDSDADPKTVLEDSINNIKNSQDKLVKSFLDKTDN